MAKRPILPFILGVAGLIPFAFFALLDVFGLGVEAATSSLILTGYGAIILSFLGGSRWGVEIHQNPENPNAVILCLAMLPSLAGWAALFLWLNAHGNWAYGLLAMGLSLQLMWDMTAIRNGAFPHWYMPLRILLTSIAALSLLAAIIL